MKTLKEGNFKNKRVLVRCDFNVAIGFDGRIADDFRIVRTIPTIKFLAKKNAVVVLMSHLENQGKPVSLRPAAKHLEKLLARPVKLLNDCVGDKTKKAVSQALPGQIILLENLRFRKEEKENDPEFARQIASMGDCYVNEAFSCSHRAHASISGIPQYLPSYAGLLLAEEIANLQKILKKPRHPFVVVIGGVKVETKSPVIANVAKIADHILMGSKIGAMILAQKQQSAGRGNAQKESAVGAIDLTSPKLHFPIDGVLALKDLSEGYLRTAAVGTMRGEEDIYDIGPETAKFFAEIIKSAKMIFFNGPMGLFEKREFSAGTSAVVEAIAQARGAYRVAGGGQTLEAIHKYKAQNSFDFLSTGGGAMLEYLAGNKLPGIKALG